MLYFKMKLLFLLLEHCVYFFKLHFFLVKFWVQMNGDLYFSCVGCIIRKSTIYQLLFSFMFCFFSQFEVENIYYPVRNLFLNEYFSVYAMCNLVEWLSLFWVNS